MNIKETIEKLKSINLEKDSIEKAIATIKDKQTWENIKVKLTSFVATKKGVYFIGYGSSLILATLMLPDSIKELQSSKNKHELYLSNIEMIDIESIEKSREQDLYENLKSASLEISEMISDNQKILYFPELVRQASAQNRIQLLALKPYNNEFDEFSENIDENIDQNDENLEAPLDDLGMMPEQDMGLNPNDPALNFEEEEYGAITELDIPELEVPNKINFETKEFSLDIQGDYIDIQRFLGEMQLYKTIYAIKSISYSLSAQSQEPNDASSTGKGLVQASLRIRIPKQTE